MKLFREYVSLGPSAGNVLPVADLGDLPAFNQALYAQKGNTVTKSDLDQVERYADKLFSALGIDVEFTKHFMDRVNDPRNMKQITSSELVRLFKQTYKKYGKKIAKLPSGAQAVINDMKTDINMPFVLNYKKNEIELIAKTVMRKKGFMTTSPKLSFESFVTEMNFFPKNLEDQITLPVPPADLQKEADKLKKIIENRTLEDEESIRNHDENSFYAIEKYCEKHGLIFHDNEMKDIVTQARPTIKYFKEHFNVPRPHEVDSSIKPMSSKTNKTKAYPSGHACQSMLVALYVTEKFPEHEKGIKEAAKECGMGRVKAGFHYLADYIAGNLLAEKMFMVINKGDYGKMIGEKRDAGYPDDSEKIGKKHYIIYKDRRDWYGFEVDRDGNQIGDAIFDPKKGELKKMILRFQEEVEEASRIPRKKGQPAGSDKHSDLYTDENPRGTIHGLGFKDVETARASVKKIENSGKKHAHKIQAAIAMEQRAREMGKKAEAAIYRTYIEKMKKITKQKNEKWSDKYKKSIDCSNPKGFSQRAHCQGKDN